MHAALKSAVSPLPWKIPAAFLPHHMLAYAHTHLRRIARPSSSRHTQAVMRTRKSQSYMKMRALPLDLHTVDALLQRAAAAHRIV